MRRIFYSRFGGPEVLQLEHTAIPQPGPGQIRVRVAGCGVNPIDFKTRSGLGFVSQTLGQRFHFVPGYDVSGVVDALSDGVSQWAPGDAVYGMVNFPLPAGACAEYVVADAGTWARAPQSIPWPTPVVCRLRASLPGRRCSMWVACNPVSGFGAGGCGRCRPSFCSACCMERRQRERHRIAGQSRFSASSRCRIGTGLSRSRSGWAAWPWDLILDLMGGAVGEQALGWLAPNGRMVTVPTNTAAQLLEKASGMARKVLAIKVQPDIAQLAQLATLVDNGQLRLHVSAALALEEAASAHEKMQQGHVKGKLILVP